MYGVVERYTAFRFGKTNIRVTFEGGSIGASGIIPAKFSTTNPIVQQAIEGGKLFKDGVVVILKSTEIEGDSPIESFSSKKDEDSVDPKDYPDVTNGQMARVILSEDPYNIPFAKLSTNASMKEVAAELNITFSNWN